MWELELNQQQLSATTACDSGKLLTSIWGVGRGSVEEPRGAWYSQVHTGIAVAIHAVADGVVAWLLRGAAGDVAPGGHAAGVPAVAHWITWVEDGEGSLFISFLLYSIYQGNVHRLE